ncbi:MAG: SDR family NAD(P)-dependent oxidoreductase, partial [Oscillospiraceae bacterium]|nr:SDR family NAD(P)-dependent oxidoreductase [Oscillospiraceae bacterium]
MLNKFSLEGKVAMVTGCEQGLGMGMAVGLAQAGADIFGVGIGDMSAVKAEVEKAGKKFSSMKANLIQQDKIDEIVTACLNEMGHID